MSATPNYVMFSAATVLHFQSAPHERPAPDEVLLVRRRDQPDGPPSDTWDFPCVGEIDYAAELEPWTDGAFRARVDAPFDPPGMSREDFSWVCQEFARDCTAVEASARAALRRFDGPLLDQILALIEGRADSAINSKLGDLQVNTATRADYTAAQAKADRVAHAFGDSAPPQLAGESLHDYKVRLAKPYQQYSKIFKTTDLNKIGDMSGIEDAIYNDALAEAAHPTMFQPGELRAVHTPDATGRKITKYFGDPNIVWDQFNPPHKYVTRFMTNGR